MNSTIKKITALAALLILLFGGIYVYTQYKQEHRSLLYYSFDKQQNTIHSSKKGTVTVGDFSFTDQNGNVVTQKTIGDAIYVADYFFVSCPGICKKMSSELEKVYAVYESNPQVKIVSHTSLPEEDTTEALMAYAVQHGVKKHDQWLFLTGDKKALYDMARNQYFIVNDEGDGGEDDFIHTERFVLVDKNKYIRGYYDGTNEQDVQKLIGDIQRLLNEE